ncbi:MAG: hypothetical protein IIB38_07450, partial [Candidatus Hydrogenedentes bacterium]|nr:hypothetical protein [Candidatus Hydrogenedentota bacterium]
MMDPGSGCIWMVSMFYGLFRKGFEPAQIGTGRAVGCWAVLMQGRFGVSVSKSFVSLMLVLIAFPAGSVAARERSVYERLWERGEYRKALTALDKAVAALDHVPALPYLYDRAQLRFAVGRVDEALEDMELVVEAHEEPGFVLDLALMQQYRGRPLPYDTNMRRAYRLVRRGTWRWSRRERNDVAVARVLELLGENPKNILSTVYRQIFERFPDSAVARVGAGDLAYRSAGYVVAEKHYLKALERDPVDQSALAGLAECYWKSHDPRLEETLSRLAGLNAHHPRARMIRVEQLLDLGKTPSALAMIEEGLAVNPNDLWLLTLKSAALFLDDEDAQMEAVQEQVLEFNPLWSAVYSTTGRIASRHYRFKQGAAFQRRALDIDPESDEALANYALDLMRLGREEEGRVQIAAAFEMNRYNVHLYNLLQLTDTLATFTSIERGAFLLRLPEHEAPVLAADALRLLEKAAAELAPKYEMELETPVLVEMFDNHDDFMVRSVGLPGNAGHLGICFGRVITMDTPSVRAKGSSSWRSVLWHEFTHVVTLQKTENRMPRWLSEGISVYEEGQHSSAWRTKRDPDYLPIVVGEERPRVEDIAAYFSRAPSPAHLMFGYFIAGEFVQFYVDTYGF